MKFRIVIEERLDGTMYYTPQCRTYRLLDRWKNIDSDGDTTSWANSVTKIETAHTRIEKARDRYRRNTIKKRTIVPA